MVQGDCAVVEVEAGQPGFRVACEEEQRDLDPQALDHQSSASVDRPRREGITEDLTPHPVHADEVPRRARA
jgi:hypothetical protein